MAVWPKSSFEGGHQHSTSAMHTKLLLTFAHCICVLIIPSSWPQWPGLSGSCDCLHHSAIFQSLYQTSPLPPPAAPCTVCDTLQASRPRLAQHNEPLSTPPYEAHANTARHGIGFQVLARLSIQIGQPLKHGLCSKVKSENSTRFVKQNGLRIVALRCWARRVCENTNEQTGWLWTAYCDRER